MIIDVDSDALNLIIEGTKTHHICTFIGENKNLKDNDIVVIRDEKRWFTAILTRVGYYNSLEHVFEQTNYKYFVPHAFSVDHAIMLYEESHNFRREELSGLVSFRIKRISQPQ